MSKSSYFTQIASRNINDQPLVELATPAVGYGLNDPFEHSIVVPAETGSVAGDKITSYLESPESVSPKLSITQPRTVEAATNSSYFTKYVERNLTGFVSRSVTIDTEVTAKGMIVQPETQRHTTLATQQEIDSPATGLVTDNKMILPLAKRESFEQEQQVDGKKDPAYKAITPTPFVQLRQAAQNLVSIVDDKRGGKTSAFLQPSQLPVLAQAAKKDIPVPALVIGKITVEIIPAPKPANKIINRIIKAPQPVGLNHRSKFSFGLGQL